MKGEEKTLENLLSGEMVFRIPYFQRQYNWEKKNWEAVWDDVLVMVEGNGRPRHFFGALVTKEVSVPSQGVTNYLVIDGQQRLITLSLFLAALRDAARNCDEILRQKIEDMYLRNRYAHGPATYKICPTSADQPRYCSVIDEQPQGAHSRILDAYHFFLTRIARYRQTHDCHSLTLWTEAVVKRLDVVWIKLDPQDDEYRIFESLNFKGMRLTQADLLRNFVFLSLPPEWQDRVYHDHWQPIEAGFRNQEDRLEDFFRCSLLSEAGVFVAKPEVYSAWKARLLGKPPQTLVEILQAWRRESDWFLCLIDPDRERSVPIARGLRRLNRWGSETIYPFLLRLYRDRADRKLTDDHLVGILGIIESFLVRRFLVGVPTNQLNKLFLALYKQLPADLLPLDATRTILSEVSRRWPGDAELRAAFDRFALFKNGKAEQQRLILETLIDADDSAAAQTLRIELLLPEQLTEVWRTEIEHAEGRAIALLQSEITVLRDTAGNLTLASFNEEAKNGHWLLKQQRLANSSLPANRELAQYASWGLREIRDRNSALAEIAVRRWPGPPSSIVLVEDQSEGAPAGVIEFSVVEPPHLRHSQVQVLKVNGSELPASWSAVLQELLRLAHVRDHGLAEIATHAGVPLQAGNVMTNGFSPVPGTDFSLQGQNADHAYEAACKLARWLGIGFYILFRWRDKQGAAYPGATGLLRMAAAARTHPA
jgi:uncharacterized protein with ParB-like and HNH nuclease domain